METVTREVIELREPRTVYAPDADADAAEVSLLQELGFTALLMVPICAADVVWGIAEVYREGIHRFVNTDAEWASRIFRLVGDRVAELEAAR